MSAQAALHFSKVTIEPAGNPPKNQLFRFSSLIATLHLKTFSSSQTTHQQKSNKLPV
jgi:hypothetical protein